MAHSSWGSGWPADRSGDMVALRVAGVEFPGGVQRGIHDLMVILLEESEDRGYEKLVDGWCWGYACRPIKNPDGSLSDTPSNHSWGIAIDVNAPNNCFGCSSHTIPAAMGDLWERYGFRWGGNYSGSKDWMHFEYMGSKDDAERHTAKAREDLLEDERLDQFENGMNAYRDKYKEKGGEDPGEPPADKPSWFKKGWLSARFAANNPHGE